jgi:exodeoxyribonuclease VII large subunit
MATRPELPFDEPDVGQRPPLSVSELTGQIKTAVEGGFQRVLVEGEVSNCRRWSSGHIYFTLKDSFAQLRAVAFRTTARQLKFDLEDGMHVVARGRIGVYEVKGEYQLICDGVDPHGLGALQAAFEQLKRRLQAEGLFDTARKRPLPILPRRIGVVTSLDGAAVRDVVRVLTSRYPGARIVVRPARVQGEGAARDLIAALRAVTGVPGVDVVIIGRGGGSVEDLWAFNDEALARAIAACSVPVIAGVGHEIDFTIADLVADVRAATPSNAAELVVDRADNLRRGLDHLSARMTQVLSRTIDARRRRVERLEMRARQWPVGVMLRDRDCQELTSRLQRLVTSRVAGLSAAYDALRRRLDARDVRRVTADLAVRIASADARLRAAATAGERAARARVGEAAGRLHALSPLSVLGRGYAVCWNEARTGIIRSSRAVSRGDGVRVTLSDGELTCRVEETS